MSWKEDFYAALLKFIKSRGVGDAAEVFGFNEYYSEPYGCETCWPGPSWEAEIYYYDSEGRSRSYTYDGRFSDLFDMLTED